MSLAFAFATRLEQVLVLALALVLEQGPLQARPFADVHFISCRLLFVCFVRSHCQTGRCVVPCAGGDRSCSDIVALCYDQKGSQALTLHT